MEWAIRLNTDKKLWIVSEKDLEKFHKQQGKNIKSKVEFINNKN